MTLSLCHQETQPGLRQNRHLLREREHRVVVRDQPIPAPRVTVQLTHQLPIVQFRKRGVDFANRD